MYVEEERYTRCDKLWWWLLQIQESQLATEERKEQPTLQESSLES